MVVSYLCFLLFFSFLSFIFFKKGRGVCGFFSPLFFPPFCPFLPLDAGFYFPINIFLTKREKKPPGFITFLPELLTGSLNLNTNLNTNTNPSGNFMLLWIYLVFFNMLFVVFPLWVLWEARRGFRGVFVGGGGRGWREGKRGKGGWGLRGEGEGLKGRG